MKKLCHCTTRCVPLFKFNLKMKLTALFLFISFFGLQASTSYSQKSVTLDLNGVKISSLLDIIERQTDFRFVYKIKDVDLERKIKLKAQEEEILAVLEKVFKGTQTGYKVFGNQIFLTEKKKSLPAQTKLSMTQQTITISGTITEVGTGMPIPGANIVELGTNNGVMSDFDGNYLIKVPEDATLEVSFIGYATQTIQANGQSEIDIALETETAALDEVVFIGYGTSTKKNITTSIATVDDIENISSRPVSTLNDFLQGSVPGVTVLQQSGDPTEQGKIVIRGYGSFADETPLTVVDGVPYYGPPINPNDIASVSILKDAAAASIYGAQAASGVIVIETKKGKTGKPQINLNFYGGIQTAVNLPTPLTAQEQADVYNRAADNAGVPRQAAHNAEENPWGQEDRTNWIDAISREGAIYNMYASVNGGTEMVSYMTSFGYNKKEGLLLGTSSERYSFRTKTDISLTDRISIGENVYYSKTEAIGTNTTGSYNGSIINAIYMPSSAPIYNEEGNFSGVVPEQLSQFAGAYGDVYNPVALLLRPTISNPVDFINANTYFKYDITDGLKFKSSFSYNLTKTKHKEFVPRIPELGRTNLTNFLYQSYSDTRRWIWDNQITYKKTFGLHDLDLTAVHSAQKTEYEYYFQEGQGFSSEEPFNQYMSNANVLRSTETDVFEDALTSLIGRLMYDFDDKYFLTASIRRDETSRLAKNNQADYFPSVSVGWRLAEENFFQIDAINELKLRASWGQIGNINSVGYYSFDVPLNSTTVIIGENGVWNDKGVYIGRQSNPYLEWETSESLDIGIDLALLNNKFSLTADYFKKTTKGMIISGLEDPHQGVSAPDVNGGEVLNTGFELGANFKHNFNDFYLKVQGNISLLNNELQNLDGYNRSGIDYIAHDDEVRSTLYPYRSAVGRKLFSTYLVPYLGIFQNQEEIEAHRYNGSLIQPNAQPGDFKFQDANNDGRITNEDRMFMNSYLPDFTYNFSFNFEYKDFDLNMLWQGVSGVEVFNGYKYTTLNASQSGYNLDNRILNSWTPENRDTNIPILSTKDSNQNFGTTSSWYLEDASYLRLKNITLGYTLPSELASNFLNNSSLRIYISGENLLTITDYSGMDPEVGGRGLDVGRYPLARIITAGINLSF